MAVDLYSSLASQVSRIRGCGIVRAETVAAGSPKKPGLIVVLRADATLWMQIRTAQPFTYPTHVVDAVGGMARPIMRHVHAGRVHLTPNEALALALAEPDELSDSDIAPAQGVYRVPDAMLGDEETYNRMQSPATPAAFWACALYKLPYFDADNPKHRNFLSFVILPDRKATLEDCGHAVMVSDPGWNFAHSMDAEDFVQITAQLHRNLNHADPLGA